MITLLILLCCSAFSVFKLQALIYKQESKISKSSLMKDLGYAGEFRPFDYGFDISFGLGELLDLSIGYY